MEFDNRVVLVTGSSSGIGERCIERFAELGATVVVNSASSVEAGEALSARMRDEFGVPSSYIQADISDESAARAMIAEVADQYGRLDILVNNAGWTKVVDHADLDGVTDDIFRKIFDINVFGTWVVTKAAMPLLRESDDGNVVNVTSIAGVRPTGSSIPYAMSKAALNHFTALMAKSHGPVRFNAVAPGLVATPWTSDWDELHEIVSKVAPVPRSATPDDCAEAVLALVRNRYASGAVLVIDGGMTQRG